MPVIPMRNIEASNNTVGLKSDGTAYALGNDDFVREVQSWYNVVEIDCKFNHAVAILADGTIKYTGF